MEGEVQGGQTPKQEPADLPRQDEGEAGPLEDTGDGVGGGIKKGDARDRAESRMGRDLSAVRPEDFDTKVPRQQFPLGVVAGSLALVLLAGTSLTRAGTVLAMNWGWWGERGEVGSYWSVRLWLLRLGLYQLQRPLERADDGFGSSITPWTSVPRAIVSDGDRDLRKGVNHFLEGHPNTVWLYDVKHKTACLLPPQQRGKARYLNIDVLVAWAEEKLRLLDSPAVQAVAELEATVVEEKLGWLRKFAADIRGWREVMDVVECTEHYVRHEGIHRQAATEFGSLLPHPTSAMACRLRTQLLEFVQAEADQARPGERLLGSSEVLELGLVS